jgi:dihydroceramide fatty acyl 2-hydroxylase
MKWVESPVPGHPRFFKSNWAEAVTKTPWWVVPLVWLPLAAYQILFKATATLPNNNFDATCTSRTISIINSTDCFLSSTSILLLVLLGIVIWQGIEYSLHRFLFHLHPTTPTGIFLHFLVHGCHHKYPMDVERLVFPPIPASWIVFIVYSVVNLIAPTPATAAAVFGGIMLGYVAYDCMHYWMHRGSLNGFLKVAHMRHHYLDSSRGYGISSPLFDFLLGTMALVKK